MAADHTAEMGCSPYSSQDLNECSCFCGLPLCGPSVVVSSERDDAELDDSCFLDGCQQHRFHFMCIGLWAKRSNTCPLCKAKIKGATRVRDRNYAPFEDCDIRPSTSGDENDVYSSMEHEDVDVEWLENVVCCVCNSGGSEDTLLLCDGRSPNCGSATHVACAGLHSLPPMDQDWLCENCTNHRLSEEEKMHGGPRSRESYFARPVTRRRRRTTKYRVNRTAYSSGTRRLIRIMNAFETRARKEARSGPRNNYSFSSSAGERDRRSSNRPKNRHLRRHRPWITTMEAYLPTTNGPRVVEAMLGEMKDRCYHLETGKVMTTVNESTEATTAASSRPSSSSTSELQNRIREAAEQQRNRGCRCGHASATSAPVSTEVKDIILNAYQRDGKTYKRPRRGLVIQQPFDISLKQMAILARECGAASKDLYENAIDMSSIGNVGSSHAIEISLELAKSILIRVGVTQKTVKARRHALEFLSSLEGVTKGHLTNSGIGRILTQQQKSDDRDLIGDLLTKWLSLVV